MTKKSTPAGGYKIKVCKKGESCGYTCIASGKTCRKNLPSNLASPLDKRADDLSAIIEDAKKQGGESKKPKPKGNDDVDAIFDTPPTSNKDKKESKKESELKEAKKEKSVPKGLKNDGQEKLERVAKVREVEPDKKYEERKLEVVLDNGEEGYIIMEKPFSNRKSKGGLRSSETYGQIIRYQRKGQLASDEIAVIQKRSKGGLGGSDVSLEDRDKVKNNAQKKFNQIVSYLGIGDV